MRQGKAELTLRYDASRAILSGAPAQDRVFAHSGEEYTPQTGLTYLRARFYDPAQGRFTTEDAYLGNQIKSLSQNRYAYCENDPVNYADAFGTNKNGRTGGINIETLNISAGLGYIPEELLGLDIGGTVFKVGGYVRNENMKLLEINLGFALHVKLNLEEKMPFDIAPGLDVDVVVGGLKLS